MSSAATPVAGTEGATSGIASKAESMEAGGAPPAGCLLKVLKDVEHMHVRIFASEGRRTPLGGANSKLLLCPAVWSAYAAAGRVHALAQGSSARALLAAHARASAAPHADA